MLIVSSFLIASVCIIVICVLSASFGYDRGYHHGYQDRIVDAEIEAADAERLYVPTAAAIEQVRGTW